jgi:hypothetical protein
MLAPFSLTGLALQPNRFLRSPFRLNWNIWLYDKAGGKDSGSVSQILGYMGRRYLIQSICDSARCVVVFDQV